MIVLGLVLVQVRRLPERSGAYLVGFSIFPGHTPITSTAPQCYAPLAVPALIAYAAVGVIGALLFGRALPRL